MIYRMRGLRAVGLCLLAAMGLVMLTAASAQAAGDWRVEGKAITEPVEVSGEIDKGVFSFLVPKIGFKLVFESFSIDEGLLLPGGKSYKVLLFTKGKLYSISPLTLATTCEVGDLTFKVKGTLFLHNGVTYELLSPMEGLTLTITTYYGGECFMPQEVELRGHMVLEANPEFATENAVQLVKQASVPLFPGHGIVFGAHPMTLDGSALLSLSGKSKGLKWSGVG